MVAGRMAIGHPVGWAGMKERIWSRTADRVGLPAPGGGRARRAGHHLRGRRRRPGARGRDLRPGGLWRRGRARQERSGFWGIAHRGGGQRGLRSRHGRPQSGRPLTGREAAPRAPRALLRASFERRERRGEHLAGWTARVDRADAGGGGEARVVAAIASKNGASSRSRRSKPQALALARAARRGRPRAAACGRGSGHRWRGVDRCDVVLIPGRGPRPGRRVRSRS